MPQAVHSTITLENLRRFVASHGFVDVHIDDDAVVFGVEFCLNGRLAPFVEWERVHTLSEARDVMGY